jgi:hypothetical protein
VQQGSIVYLALEGGKGFEARIEAFRQRFLPEDAERVPFFLVADALNVVKEHADLVGCIRLQTGKAPDTIPPALSTASEYRKPAPDRRALAIRSRWFARRLLDTVTSGQFTLNFSPSKFWAWHCPPNGQCRSLEVDLPRLVDTG